jgi:hypothetical protein
VPVGAVKVTQGLPLGALPPPGLYGSFGNNATGLGSSPGKGNQSAANATNPAFSYGESLLWLPGWTFLCASYAASRTRPEVLSSSPAPLW